MCRDWKHDERSGDSLRIVHPKTARLSLVIGEGGGLCLGERHLCRSVIRAMLDPNKPHRDVVGDICRLPRPSGPSTFQDHRVVADAFEVGQ